MFDRHYEIISTRRLFGYFQSKHYDCESIWSALWVIIKFQLFKFQVLVAKLSKNLWRLFIQV